MVIVVRSSSIFGGDIYQVPREVVTYAPSKEYPGKMEVTFPGTTAYLDGNEVTVASGIKTGKLVLHRIEFKLWSDVGIDKLVQYLRLHPIQSSHLGLAIGRDLMHVVTDVPKYHFEKLRSLMKESDLINFLENYYGSNYQKFLAEVSAM